LLVETLADKMEEKKVMKTVRSMADKMAKQTVDR